MAELNNEKPQENRKRRRNFNERVQENDEKQRSVSFTKRRYGLFNKAAELFMLCDAQLAVLVSSTKGNRKIYSFGYPSVNSVLDDYLNVRKPNPINDGDKMYALSLCNQIKELEDEVKNITERSKKLKNGEVGLSSVLDLFENSESVEELQALVNGLEKLRDDAKTRVDRTVSCVASNDHCVGSSLFSEKGKGKLIDSNMITDLNLPSFKFDYVSDYKKNNSSQDHDENWSQLNTSDYYHSFLDAKTRVDRAVSCVASNDHGIGSSLFSEKGKGKLIESNMIADLNLPSLKFGYVNDYEKNNLSNQYHDENWSLLKNCSFTSDDYPSFSDDHKSPLIHQNLTIDDDPFGDLFDGFWSN
ncbi:agamous-like MADS-box protein AGL14 [Mercurialis annua]|uniref:agamous-like MADS-box protein AGL14 n=1 Tax=Mercurialis annua TaxID=3986 RepID=UPI00215EBB72|nr:agamous-like MADS-box protein AGL14 [Mercurialis annua]